ncbi:uncharacterized protein LOC122863320 [Siniperca chuatsi]|uniref:uncharacterized protein LOC122863320 n=1 Tax=Siniperca chuatsi TaxID=119488 RepID=UPI001CE190F3|nr:uncharacterized protein LOC122863320 [Siniperca chuatsi]
MKALRKRKNLEHKEEKKQESVDYRSNSERSLDKDFQPGPGEEDSSSSSSSSSQQPPKTALEPSAASTSTSRKPTRVTVYRRKQKEEKDGEVLSKSKAEGSTHWECTTCGGPRRLDVYYKGELFCSMTAGPSGKMAQQWLEERKASTIPRTTLWRRMKEEEDSEPPEGKKKRKTHKLRTCQKCSQPALKDFGHSQHHSKGKKEHFCAQFYRQNGRTVVGRKESQGVEERGGGGGEEEGVKSFKIVHLA